MVDGERKITFYKPLPTSSAGKKFQIRSRVLGVYDKGKASVVEIEQSLVDEKGDVYTKVIGSSFYVGQGNWGGPKGINSSYTVGYVQILTQNQAPAR